MPIAVVVNLQLVTIPPIRYFLFYLFLVFSFLFCSLVFLFVCFFLFFSLQIINLHDETFSKAGVEYAIANLIV